jgi:hypothetical protein
MTNAARAIRPLIGDAAFEPHAPVLRATWRFAMGNTSGLTNRSARRAGTGNS